MGGRQVTPRPPAQQAAGTSSGFPTASSSTCLHPNFLFYREHQSRGVRTHPNDLFNLGLFKGPSPHLVRAEALGRSWGLADLNVNLRSHTI